MLNDALQLLLDTLLQPFAVILLLRFHLQWLRAPMHNPFGAFIISLTNFLVLRTRRFIPSALGLDTASLLLAYTMEMFYLSITLWLSISPSGFPVAGLLLLTLIKLINISIYLLMAALFIQALLSWFNPHSSMAGVTASITKPFLLPLQRRIPVFGNIDLSLFLLFILCQLILIVPMHWLENMARSLF